jgi:hypothetical protein
MWSGIAGHMRGIGSSEPPPQAGEVRRVGKSAAPARGTPAGTPLLRSDPSAALPTRGQGSECQGSGIRDVVARLCRALIPLMPDT